MAFLCPVRIKSRSKKKKGGPNELDKELSASGLGLNHGIGRITGSASIETLVRVGIEKEHGLSPDSKMVVLHDFTPCVDDELEVKRGQVVNILYRENDWVYVIGQESRQEGFIPFSYCAPFPYNNHGSTTDDMAVKKKLPRDQQIGSLNSTTSTANATLDPAAATNPVAGQQPQQLLPEILSMGPVDSSSSLMHLEMDQVALQASHSQASLSSDPDFLPFAKDPSGRYIVLYTFIARDENDVSVERGEFVTVLNREDPDWFWIVRSDGQEGFIPSGFVYPADNVLHKGQGHVTMAAVGNNNNMNMVNNGPGMMTTSNLALNNNTQQQQQQVVVESNNNNNNNMSGQMAADDLRYHGTELVMLYDYKAQAPDDLSVRRGDWIYSDLNNQTVDGWLWSYAPKTRKYGFIPKAYARPPAMTSL